jgi:hypothetical protein
MCLIGVWELILFEHWVKNKLLENELKFSKRLNEFQSNSQLLILNQDYTFIIESTNKKFNLNSVYQGKYVLANNSLILSSVKSDSEEFELKRLTNNVLELEQKFKLPFDMQSYDDSVSHFFRFGFVKVIDSKKSSFNQSTRKTNPFK